MPGADKFSKNLIHIIEQYNRNYFDRVLNVYICDELIELLFFSRCPLRNNSIVYIERNGFFLNGEVMKKNPSEQKNK